MPAQRSEDARLIKFKNDGYAVFDGFYSPQQVRRLRQILVPEFEAIFAADPAAARAKLGAPLEGSDGGGAGGRNAGVGGLLVHRLWPQLSPILHAPWHAPQVLDFCEQIFGPLCVSAADVWLCIR
eukprot:SAG31_NODE_4908_length_2873_cov_2.949171_3_plen_125_part_00